MISQSEKTNPIQTQFLQRPKMNVNVFVTKDYENETAFRLQKNKPNQTQFQTAGKRTKEAKKKKRASRTFLRWVAGNIDFLDGCDIILEKIYGKSQFNLIWRLIL